MKICTKCEVAQPLASFQKSKASKDGLLARCRSCVSVYWKSYYKANADHLKSNKKSHPDDRLRAWLKFSYGITLAGYDQMLSDQGGTCWICDDPPGAKRLSVDHDHSTGEVRGLLCAHCNSGLGFFGDDPDTLARAIEYLTRN